MASVVIVAIPDDNDYVWKISSEKIPHMTLLFLGEMEAGPELARIESFVSHVVSTSMYRFGMTVDHRGTLGPEDADVLFLKTEYSKMIESARADMLANSDIRKAYNAAQQFPEWTPHLTLGYPATPAHPDTRDYPGIGWINFDRIGLWFGDSEGPEFRLKDREEVMVMGESFAEKILEHHGVKGMKWGVRSDRGHEGEKATTKAIAKADKKFEKSFKPSTGNWIKVNNTFAKHVNPMLDELNSNPKYSNKNLYENKKLHDSYFKDYEKVVSKAAKATTEEFGTNASGTRQMKVERVGFGENSTWQAQLVDVKHAIGDVPPFLIIPTFNATGHVIGQTIKPVDDTLAQSVAPSAEDILKHHGVKGMKWGVRRDNARSDVASGGGRGRITRAERNAKGVTIVTNPDKNKRVKVAGGKGNPIHEDAAKVIATRQKAKKSGTHTLSNAELKLVVERMNLEQQLKRLNSPNKSEAHKFVEQQLKSVGQQKVQKLASK